MEKHSILENLFQSAPEVNVYEYVLEDGDELSLSELKILNELGYVYHSEQTDIDFDDNDEFGLPTTRYMNIYYFSKASENVHENQFVY
jgi:hypothetical protein